MNSIHGTLAQFMSERLAKRTPKHPVISCLAQKPKYLPTYEGAVTQTWLLPKSSPFIEDRVGYIVKKLVVTSGVILLLLLAVNSVKGALGG